MSDRIINGVQVPFIPIGGPDGIKKSPVEQLGGRSFENVLERELEKVKFSKHAQDRLEARNIQLNEKDILQIETAVAKAEAKGAQESLVLLRDMAFIISIKNKTVVTAMHGETMRDNVFTNIDSAIIAAE
jgi:flagellar operon protein